MKQKIVNLKEHVQWKQIERQFVVMEYEEEYEVVSQKKKMTDWTLQRETDVH